LLLLQHLLQFSIPVRLLLLLPPAASIRIL
jgi:hypothetical protein